QTWSNPAAPGPRQSVFLVWGRLCPSQALQLWHGRLARGLYPGRKPLRNRTIITAGHPCHLLLVLRVNPMWFGLRVKRDTSAWYRHAWRLRLRIQTYFLTFVLDLIELRGILVNLHRADAHGLERAPYEDYRDHKEGQRQSRRQPRPRVKVIGRQLHRKFYSQQSKQWRQLNHRVQRQRPSTFARIHN